MSEELQMILEDTKEQMHKALEHLGSELATIRAGKANPAILNNIMAEAYGAMTPLNQLGNISAPDARQIVIQPWDKSVLQSIEKAIQSSNLGLNPQNDGEIIRLIIPPLTEERRRDLVKQVKQQGEHTKVSLRNIRREANDEVKKMQKDGLAEDLAKDAESQVQKLTDSMIAKVDDYCGKKEKEIMTV